MKALRQDFQSDGMAWLCACAVYPALYWRITVMLGERLITDSERYAVCLAQIVRLPWMRAGFMPNWLREALLAELPPPLEAQVRQMLAAFLSLVFDDAQATARDALQVAIAPGQRMAGVAQVRKDAVFLRFMSGRSPRLVVDAGERLRQLLYRQGAPLAGPRRLPLAVAGMFGGVLAASVLWVRVEIVPDKPTVAAQASVISPLVSLPPVLARPGDGMAKLVVAPTSALPSVGASESSAQKLDLIPLPTSLGNLLLPGSKECDFCPEMVRIPAGQFQMGSNTDDNDERPAHLVKVAEFMMSKYEVTQGQWKAVMGNNPSDFWQCGNNCPVEDVSWDDAQAYVAELNAKTGVKYRLPSEAEWEYVARADGLGRWGYETQGWYGGTSGGKTHPVGLKLANKFGLHDMYGNVWEWVEDCYHENYNGAPTDGSAWTIDCQEGSTRVLRGGGWNYDAQGARSSARFRPGGRGNFTGFRLAFGASGSAGQ